ncbi:MAG: hypothetical protein HYR94_23570 [Chloroflexi bacterium]|nr:hypothetical protein [Chloroflexota bacterium]
MGRISKRLKRQLSKVITGPVSPGLDLYQVAQQAKDQTEPIEMPDHFRDFHPVHAVYLAAQNTVSFLAEQLSVLPELAEYYDMMVEAEDEYMPDGPPLSPLTRTYFTTWAFFDAPFGRDRETIGTCVLDLGPDLGLAGDYLEIIRLMQQSRMGLYEHQGVRGEYVHLQELITGQTHPCRVPAGYLGQAGELWYARIFPAPFGLSDESLVFTTPYLLISPAKKQ